MTAMQEMLEWTRKTFPMDLNTPRMIEHKIETLLEKEKEQMLNFYMWMRMNENTEKYLDYTDEDMFREYLNQKQ